MKKILFLILALVAMATTAMAQSDATWSVKLIKAGDQKLNVIKVVKEDLGIGLNEAKNLVESAPCMLLENVEEEQAEALAKKLRNLGATVTLLHNGIEVTLDDNDGSLWSVRLDEVGSQKLEVVKAVKEETGLGLKEAKDLVDSAPCIVLENVVQERAEAFAQKLRAIGATVTVQIAINATNFPDANFRNYLLAQSYGEDAILTDEEIAAVKEMDVNNKNIANLKGIEFFTELTHLNCSSNSLTSLNVANLTKLRELDCHQNKLKSLDVSKSTKLVYIRCEDNQLTSLDVSNNTALDWLWCTANQLTSLDVSANTALTKLTCHSNPLTSLDVSKNTALEELACGWNQLTSLDLSKNTALTYLECGNNQLTSLDLSNNTALDALWCFNTQLTSLDLSKNTALRILHCFNNQLTSLDVPKSTKLVYIRCYNNQLTSLDVSNNTALLYLHCYNNQLTSLDVSKNTNLRVLFCDGNQIKGDKMQALVNSLPTVEGEEKGQFSVINTKYENEKNVITKSQVAIAKGKNWKVYDNNGGSAVEYDGVDDDAAADTYVISFTQKVTDLSTFGPQAEMAIPYLPLLGIVDQEQRDGLTVFKSKPGGKELMVYDPSAKTITVCDGVTSADNISYEISPEIHQLIKIMNKNVDPFEGYNRLLIKFEVGATGIGGVEADGLDKAAWYTLDGKKLGGEPTRKGVYIYKGRKVVK